MSLDGDDMRYIAVVHDEAWAAIEEFVEGRGLRLMRMPAELNDPSDPTPTYILSPIALREQGTSSRTAPTGSPVPPGP